MPRVHAIAKCRKSPGECGKCGDLIWPGSPYLFWAFAFSPRSIRCAKPECRPKPWDLTRSAYYQALYQLQAEEWSADTVDELEAQRDNMVGEVEQLRDEQEEKKSNMPDALQDSSSGELLQERYDSLDEAANALSSVDCTFEEPNRAEGVKDEEYEVVKAEALTERLQEIRDELDEALQGIS